MTKKPLPKINGALGELVESPPDVVHPRPSARKPHKTTGAERKRIWRERKSEQRKRCLAVLDFETDPFDNVTRERIAPFAACLYSDQFEPVVIWEENEARFIDAVICAIEALPDCYTIYAHNGGKFDFLFLIHRLRGDVKFKGRGIMCARIGPHELRDSFHIIPERLANFQKDAFDYTKLKKARRSAYRAEIIAYMKNDCRYLFDIVRKFVDGFGLKISIGQAAMYELKKHYEVKRFSEGWDAYVRQWYMGGRVECLQGAGHFKGDYKLIDTNSMYPFAMANYRHPIGDFWDYRVTQGPISNDTVFIELYCKNRGAFIGRDDEGLMTSRVREGVFKTTIWEFEVAVKHGLISDVQIIQCLDCPVRTTFEKFVTPLYQNRLLTKQVLSDMKKQGLENTAQFIDVKKDDIFYKLLLNNAYGKFCQDPKKYREHYLTDPGDQPPKEWWDSVYALDEIDRMDFLQPLYESDRYWIWCKPSPSFRYNNVGTGASITGASRAVLLDALQCAHNPIYCDTDSIICTGWDDSKLRIHKTDLGAWDLEDEFSEVVISGKKLYSVWHKKPKARTAEEIERGIDPRYTIKSKGTAGVTWLDMLAMLDGQSVAITNRAPTFDKYQRQNYITRNIRRTAPIIAGELPL